MVSNFEFGRRRGMRESVSRRCAIVTAAALASTSRPTPGAAADLAGNVAVVSTAYGDLRFRLLPGAPQALALFTSLAAAGYYDESAFTAMHADCIVGGDPNSRLGYGPADRLVNAGFFYGKVRAWGSDESRVSGGARTACPAGTLDACTLARRIPAEVTSGRVPRFGSLALALGGQPGMVAPSKPGTVGSQFEIGLGPKTAEYYPNGRASPPVIGQLAEEDAEGARLLRRLAAAPVANGYLSEAKGRSMPGTPGFARPRDIPCERQAVLRMRIERG